MERIIEVGKLYHHFKGHKYIVRAIAYDSEKYQEDDKESSRVVVYEDIERNIYWVRPYNMFNSLVDRKKYPNIKQKYRFEEIRKEDINESK